MSSGAVLRILARTTHSRRAYPADRLCRRRPSFCKAREPGGSTESNCRLVRKILEVMDLLYPAGMRSLNLCHRYKTSSAPRIETLMPAGRTLALGAGLANKCVTNPPTIEPTRPSTVVHSNDRCICIIDFATKPAINPTMMYQIR